MPGYADESLLLFVALVGLYSPIAAVSSYLPLLAPFNARQQLRLALGLFVNVATIALVTILVGEPLLVLLGITTAALSATGGISLMLAAVPLMTGATGGQGEHPPAPVNDGADGPDGAAAAGWRSVVFMPLTFPLTIGGATVAILIGFRAEVSSVTAIVWLSVGAVGYALVTGLCVFLAGHVERRVSDRTRVLLDRVAGILLVAIASTLLASGFTRLVIDVLHHVKIL